jgi:hypothetical protein
MRIGLAAAACRRIYLLASKDGAHQDALAAAGASDLVAAAMRDHPNNPRSPGRRALAILSDSISIGDSVSSGDSAATSISDNMSPLLPPKSPAEGDASLTTEALALIATAAQLRGISWH